MAGQMRTLELIPEMCHVEGAVYGAAMPEQGIKVLLRHAGPVEFPRDALGADTMVTLLMIVPPGLGRSGSTMHFISGMQNCTIKD